MLLFVKRLNLHQSWEVKRSIITNSRRERIPRLQIIEWHLNVQAQSHLIGIDLDLSANLIYCPFPARVLQRPSWREGGPRILDNKYLAASWKGHHRCISVKVRWDAQTYKTAAESMIKTKESEFANICSAHRNLNWKRARDWDFWIELRWDDEEEKAQRVRPQMRFGPKWMFEITRHVCESIEPASKSQVAR